MFQFWMVIKYLKGSSRFLTWTTILALIGMILGVASLVATMSVVSGVESALKSAIVDATGDMMLIKTGGYIDDVDSVSLKVKKTLKNLKAITPFVHLEAVLAKGGRISGIVLQGERPESVESVINLRDRLVSGKFSIGTQKTFYEAVVGKGIASKFNLKVGDNFQVVVPKPSKQDATSFVPKRAKFIVSGIVDLGKYEYNQRIVICSSLATAKFNGDEKYSGLRMKLENSDMARKTSLELSNSFGYPWWTRDWYDINQNFFSAVAIEKVVIFIVLLFMVVVASFNISSTLFVSVLKKYADISILKTMGATQKFLVKLFVVQGMIVGFIGSVLGVLLGVFLCFLLKNSSLAQVPGEIYKFDHLSIEIRMLDILIILVASLVVCFLSTLFPSQRGSKLNPVEGLRYE